MVSLAAALPNWLKAFMLLSAAHTAPWAAGHLLGERLAAPPGLDEIPEALTPLLTLSTALGIGAGAVWTLTGVFTLADLAAMPLRRHPPDDVSA
ncbi:MAG: hypothetical protein WBW93_11975 [Steroidobacteraceae bacterium]